MIKDKKEDGTSMNVDLKDMFNLAKKYLGDQGVEKLLNGDYSQLEKIGKQILGGEVDGAEIMSNVLKAIPKAIGDKLDLSENIESDQK